MSNYAKELIDNSLSNLLNPFTEDDLREALRRVENNPITPEDFIGSLVAQVSTANFAVGMLASILGTLLVKFIADAKARMETPEMPPPPKWIEYMTKELTKSGLGKDQIIDKLKVLWDIKSREEKTAIYEKHMPAPTENPKKKKTKAEHHNPMIGKHSHIPDEKFDGKQLAMGIKIEKEHTDNEEIAKEIAKDHLSEYPDYYTRLLKMEAEAEKEKKKSK